MARNERRADPRLIDRLRAEPHRFGLMEAEQALLAAGQGPVRFTGAIGAAFPGADLQRLRTAPDGSTLIETGAVTFFGPQGVLPAPLGEAVARLEREREARPRGFFDLFGDRLTRLLLDTLRLERPAVARRPPEASAQGDILRALIGRLAGDPDATDRALMALAGLLRQRPASLHAAERAVASHFGVTVRGRPLVGGWTKLPKAMRARLGVGARRGPPLGRGATLGAQVWTQAAGVRLDIGPLDGATFAALLPHGRAHGALAALAAATLPATVDVDCRLIVRADQTPRAHLGGARLGHSAWLGGAARAADGAADIRLGRARPDAAA